MATGMAIMGFGGGAMIGSPLADRLMKRFATPTSVGVAETFATLGVLYFAAMMAGSLGYRLPPPGWQPPGGAAQSAPKALVTRGHVHVRDVHRTPQFWLLWAVLCLNVSAGIGVIGMASPMLQEVFGARLLGLAPGAPLDVDQRAQLATVGAAFAGLLSLFNIGGRFGWASLSDRIGRKVTYALFFALGVALYAAAPAAGRAGNVPLFVALCCVIVTMYGGGFATIPAYLADLFGTRFVGAIHGRLLTAWSTAGVVGPVVVNYLREAQLAAGVAPSRAYNVTLYVLAALLAAGFACNLLVRPVAARFFMTPEEVAATEVKVAAEDAAEARAGAPTSRAALGLAWVAVAAPMAWGVAVTLQKAAALFR
jgi:MFS family permease